MLELSSYRGLQWLRFTLLSFHKYMCIIYTVFWGRFKFTHEQCVSVLAQEDVSPKQSSTCTFYLPRRENFSAEMAFLPEQTQLVTVPRQDMGAGLGLRAWLVCPPTWALRCHNKERRPLLVIGFYVVKYLGSLIHNKVYADSVLICIPKKEHSIHQNIFKIIAKLLSNLKFISITLVSNSKVLNLCSETITFITPISPFIFLYFATWRNLLLTSMPLVLS